MSQQLPPYVVATLLPGLPGKHGGSPSRDFVALRKRRMRAARMFAKGDPPVVVAEALGVTCQAACNWRDQWLQGGRSPDAMRGTERAGRLPRLSQEQLAGVEARLLQGALKSGYATDLWTLKRVAEVIERETKVSYHPGHVWRLLRQLGWSRQKPARRAAERNQEAITAWVKESWPRVKKT